MNPRLFHVTFSLGTVVLSEDMEQPSVLNISLALATLLWCFSPVLLL